MESRPRSNPRNSKSRVWAVAIGLVVVIVAAWAFFGETSDVNVATGDSTVSESASPSQDESTTPATTP